MLGSGRTTARAGGRGSSRKALHLHVHVLVHVLTPLCERTTRGRWRRSARIPATVRSDTERLRRGGRRHGDDHGICCSPGSCTTVDGATADMGRGDDGPHGRLDRTPRDHATAEATTPAAPRHAYITTTNATPPAASAAHTTDTTADTAYTTSATWGEAAGAPTAGRRATPARAAADAHATPAAAVASTGAGTTAAAATGRRRDDTAGGTAGGTRPGGLGRVEGGEG